MYEILPDEIIKKSMLTTTASLLKKLTGLRAILHVGQLKKQALV